ncbi:MAG: response regulator transcription factor [Coriobacteriia bacterium]|nr:response regulator transcription factor [Coriobacteriia bacterium]
MNNGTEAGTTILVVDDEAQLLRAVGGVLGQRGYEMVPVTTGEEAIEYAATNRVDAIILDLELPGISGLEVCRVVREYSDVPILVLSVREGEADKIAALDLGADDYLTKPFSSGELLARIRAMLRRVPATERDPGGVMRLGGLTVDPGRRTVEVEGQAVKLTRMEFDILATLMRNADRVMTTRSLIQGVWGDYNQAYTKALRVHISHLRSKIEDDPSDPKRVCTEPGVGYRLSTTRDG